MNKLMIIMIISTLMMSGIASVSGATMKIYPNGDAQVKANSANTNYGSIDSLGVGLNGAQGKYRTYLKFDLTPLSGRTINSATFSIKPNNNQNNPTINLYLASTDWSEGTIKWSIQPSYTTLIDSEYISSLDRIFFDVKNYLTGNTIAFAMVENGENQFAQFFSKEYYSVGGEEDNAMKPYLLVDYVGESCPNVDYSNVCCQLSSVQMMTLMNKFNRFEVSYTSVQMMNFINKFNRFEALC